MSDYIEWTAQQLQDKGLKKQHWVSACDKVNLLYELIEEIENHMVPWSNKNTKRLLAKARRALNELTWEMKDIEIGI